MADEYQNPSIQFNKQAFDQLTSTATVVYDGDPIDTSGLEKWFELSILGTPVKPPRNGTSRGGEEWLFQVDCYAHAQRIDSSGAASVNTVWQMVDAVYAAFDRLDVSVLDWDTAGGGSAVGTLMFGQVTADRVRPHTAGRGLMRVACTVPGHFVPV